jgi:polysaccharide export outer membrane protein
VFVKVSCIATVLLAAVAGMAHGQAQQPERAPGAAAAAVTGVNTPPGFVIGPDDVLSIVYWREKDLSADVVVRPDGMISLPLLNEIKAEGLTPEQLRQLLTTAAAKFVEEPTVSIVVKAINSRKVYVNGQVGKPGPYALSGPMTVLQLIATAGGVAEYAKKSKILIIRNDAGKTVALPFNYEEVMEGKRLQQNIELRPGDTIIVP